MGLPDSAEICSWKLDTTFSTGYNRISFFYYLHDIQGRCDGWAKVLGIVLCLFIHLLWIRRTDGAKKLNVPRNGSMRFPTAGQSTWSAGFLSPLHARLSLNTWQVKPEGTMGGGVAVHRGRRRRRRRRRRRGRGRGRRCTKNNLSVLICSYAGCVDAWICVLALSHSLTFLLHLSNSLSLSLSLPPSSLFTLQGYSLLFIHAGIIARSSSFLSEDHVTLFERKCLLCCLIHFHWDQSLRAGGFLLFPPPSYSTCTMRCHTSQGWSGLGSAVVGGCSGGLIAPCGPSVGAECTWILLEFLHVLFVDFRLDLWGSRLLKSKCLIIGQ